MELVLFTIIWRWKKKFICDRVRYLLGIRSSINYVISHNYAKTEVVLYDSLPLEKTLSFHKVVIHIKSVWNKDQSHYYYYIFFEKCSYQLTINNDNQ